MLKKDSRGWIVENNSIVREVNIINITSNLITIKFNNTVIRLPEHRIYENFEDAINSITTIKPKRKINNPYDHWH